MPKRAFKYIKKMVVTSKSGKKYTKYIYKGQGKTSAKKTVEAVAKTRSSRAGQMELMNRRSSLQRQLKGVESTIVNLNKNPWGRNSRRMMADAAKKRKELTSKIKKLNREIKKVRSK